MNAEVKRLYGELESTLMPIIKNASLRVARVLREDPDDVMQEVRIALLDALGSYDYNRSRGGIHAFARASVRTATFNILYRAASRGRTRKAQDGGREWVPVVTTASDELDMSFANDNPTPDSLFEEAQLSRRYRKLKMRLLNRLSGHHIEVFRCLYHPKADFRTYLRNRGVNEATNVHVAEFLGFSKNVIDWSVHIIKHEFTILAEEELGGFVNLAIRQGFWPMIHYSDRAEDAELVRNVIAKRSLDARPIEPPQEETSERARRVIERYPWGCVLFLQLDDRHATLVLEGRFNQRTGEVIGPGGHWKGVGEFIDWYLEMERDLRRRAKDVA